MVDGHLLAACVALAAVTYAVRLAGVRGGTAELPETVDRHVQRAVAVLLAAVAATALLDDGAVDWHRAAGVLAGTVAALCRLPLAVVVLAAAGTTALLRAVT